MRGIHLRSFEVQQSEFVDPRTSDIVLNPPKPANRQLDLPSEVPSRSRRAIAYNVHALPNLGTGGTRAPARGMTGHKLGRRARTRPEPEKL